MLEVLTGTGLAFAAGLNAYIPLLAIGLGSRFLDFVELPAGWAWLSNEWVLVVLGVLLVIEIVADKIPVVDNVNDWLQTIIRPAAGGIVFGSGSTTETALVTDPASFLESNQWVPIVTGIVIALLVHGVKAASRPIVHALTFGMGGAAVSAAEDVGSVGLSLAALLLPALVIVFIVAIVAGFIAVFRRGARLRRKKRAASPA